MSRAAQNRGARAEKSARSILRARAMALLAPGALFAAALLIAALAVEVDAQLRAMRAAPQDDVRWTLLQLEVDVTALQAALSEASATDARLELAPLAPQERAARAEAFAELRRRFDILWSRADVLVDGRAFAAVRRNSAVHEGLAAVRRYLQANVEDVDGPDDQLADALPRITAGLEALRPVARAAAVDGVQIFAVLSDQRRQNFARLLQITAMAALGLIVALIAALAGLRRQVRISIRQGKEASASRQRFASAINASLDAIVVADAEGRILVWNHAAEQVFGHSRSTAVGGDMAELIVPAALRGFHRRGVERYLKTGERRLLGAGRQETRGLRADGAETPVEISIAAAEGETGPIFISFIRDISDRIEADRALLRARDEAMAADRAKSDFIAVMSHEMRTPLNGVLGTLDLLDRTHLDESQRRYLRTAIASGEILLRHVNDVLDIARIEANRFDPDPAPFTPGRLLEELALVTRPLIEEGGNSFRLVNRLPAGTLVGDARRIEQVLLNLLGNAAKFTREGEVVLEAHAVEQDEDRLIAEFAVRDDGPGVAREDQARIFEDFVTLQSSYDRKNSGAGLGLGICRRIIHALDGKIGVESAPEQGARFWIRLPLRRAGEETVEPPSRRTGAPDPAGGRRRRRAGDAPRGDMNFPAGKRKVLVVEDNETNRFVAREMLEAQHCEVHLANDGRAGVEAAAAQKFDLILMDISMPGMDGVAATLAIRASSGPNARSRILGLTAHALPEEQERFRTAGMDGCLTKPLRMATLVEALAAESRIAPVAEAPAGEETPEEEELLDSDVLADLTLTLAGAGLGALLRRAAAELSEGVADLGLQAEQQGILSLAAPAHKLAGTAGLVGVTAVRRRLAELETACKEGAEDDAAAALAALPALIDAARPALEEIAAEADRDQEAQGATG